MRSLVKRGLGPPVARSAAEREIIMFHNFVSENGPNWDAKRETGEWPLVILGLADLPSGRSIAAGNISAESPLRDEVLTRG